MKLLFENWRKYLNENTAAFHGYKMNPTQMRVSPQCDAPPNNNQWEVGEKGCPQFSNERGVSDDHEDIVEAIEFLNNIKPSDLIAYSRGGAIAFAALPRSNHTPNVTFVAPAWKRGWVSGLTPSYSNGIIIHGTMDEAVPLRQSFELSKLTGMKLFVVPNKKHVSILKDKQNPGAGVEITSDILQQGLEHLPEWEGASSPEEVEKQHNVTMELIK